MPYINDSYGNRFLLGIHRGIVVDRNDNLDISEVPHRGRIKVKIPFLTPELDHEYWCDACFPSHQFFSVPDVGTLVYVMFNGGNPEQPVWIGAVNSTNASKDPPERFRLDEPDNSGYESLGGHFLEFHDKPGIRHIRLEDSAGNYHLYDTELNDLEVFFANDERRTIGRDRTTDIGRDDTIDIGRDNFIDIVRDQTENIGANRTTTVEDDDTLTVTTGNRTITVETGNQAETVETGNKTTDVNTGFWHNTVEQDYELVGQSTAKFDFQDKIEVITADNLEFTVTSDWIADVTGDTTWTFTGNWTVDITGTTTFTGSDDITIEATATKVITLKNSIFEFEIGAATSTWKVTAGTASIAMTAASITITVGGASWTITSGGVVFAGSTYVLSGVDHISHRHVTFGTPPFTGTPVP